MRKVLLFLMLSLCFINVLFCAATSHFELSYNGVKNGIEGSLEIGATLTVNNSISVGFASEPISDFSSAIKNSVTLAELDTVDASGFFKMNPNKNLYMYWRVSGDSANLPEIYLEIASPLINTLAAKTSADASDIVHWKATWNSSTITSKKDADNVNKIKVFPRTEDEVSTSGIISEFYHSIKLELATLEPYWDKPAVLYTGDLLVTVSGV